MRKNSRFILLLLVAAALALRIPGTVWELPGEHHLFSYHPDELPLLGAASTIHPVEGQLNPRFYNYGTLHIYILSAAVMAAGGGNEIDLGLATLLGRLISVLMACGTVVVCWFAGGRLGGFAGAVTAGAFIAVAPLHVQQSQFVTVDVPATFWVSLALFGSIATKDAFGGLASGLAAAAKYSAGAVLVAPLAAVLLRGDRSRIVRGLALCILLALLGFLIGCPGVILWTRDFLNGFLFEMRHASSGHGLVFVKTGPGWLYHLIHSLLPGLGWPLLALSLSAVAFALIRGTWATRAVLIFAAVYFAMISSSEVRFARYTLALYPAFALLAAGMFSSSRPKAAGVLAAGAMLLTLPYTLILEAQFVRQDPRTAAARWISSNLDPGTSIALPGVPWFYTPPLSPLFGQLSTDSRRQAAEEVADYHILIPPEDWDTHVLEEDPQAVIISSYEAQDRKRLEDPSYTRFIRELRSGYRMVRTFGGDPPVAPFALVANLPHDMQYVSPEITIYERREQRESLGRD